MHAINKINNILSTSLSHNFSFNTNNSKMTTSAHAAVLQHITLKSLERIVFSVVAKTTRNHGVFLGVYWNVYIQNNVWELHHQINHIFVRNTGHQYDYVPSWKTLCLSNDLQQSKQQCSNPHCSNTDCDKIYKTYVHY